MSNQISITKILLYHSRNYSAVWSSLPGIRGKDQVYLLQHRFSITNYSHQFSSVQVAQSCLCDGLNRATPGLPVHHQLPEFTQIHVHKNKIKNEAQFEKYQNLDMAVILELSDWKYLKNCDQYANDSNAKK